MNRLPKIICVLLVLLMAGEIVQAQKVIFGIFTDVHYADIPDRGTRKYSQSLKKLSQCIETLTMEKAGFLVELGDFKDMPLPADKNATLGYLQTVEKTFSRFNGDRYHVLGNHDVDCISKKEFFSIAVGSNSRADSSWFSFLKGGYLFVVLDACYDSTGQSYNSGNFDWKDSNVPEAELKWLSRLLDQTKFPVIVFVHQQLNGDSGTSVKNAAKVREILEKESKVKCVFQGHEHSGGYEQINGIPYYTLKGMIEGDFPGSNSFALVTLDKDKIFIRGYGNAESETILLK